MQEQFNLHIENTFPELQSSKFLVACSGGIDSTVLTHLCANANLDFELAHCNFQLRGKESDKDAVFVQDLANNLGVKFNVNTFETKDYVSLHKVSIQVSARELRYAWFSELLVKNNLDYLVTAHHAEDDLETFIINLSRGSGIDGLKGMPSNTAQLKRPLLVFSREQIVAYAQENSLEWREDKSNADTKYLRNKIRHQIVPLLKELHPSFLDNFSNTQDYLHQTSAIAAEAIDQIKADLFHVEGGVTKISLQKLQDVKPLKAYLYALFKSYGFKEWDNVASLLTAMSGKEIRSSSHRLLKDRAYLLLMPLQDQEISKESYFILENETLVEKPISLAIHSVGRVSETSNQTVYIDKEKIKYPLTVRKWKKGDYFYPFGMRGKKKLAKFFKDEKMDVFSKEDQWLLCSESKIVWVIGKRADDRFKVNSETKSILKLEVI